MDFIKKIIKSFLGMFSVTAPKAAKLAGILVAQNNKDKVYMIMPVAKLALSHAKEGRLDAKGFNDLKANIIAVTRDEKVKMYLEMIDPEDFNLEYGKLNVEVIKIIEAFIAGCEAGV